MSITVRDIAELAGVSITTVSRVLNDSPSVSEQTKKRVRKIIAESGYVRAAVKPKKPEKTVCIVISDDTDRSPHAHPTVYTILSGLTSRLTELGISNRLHMLADDDESTERLLELKADGYVFIRTRSTQEDAVIPRLLSQGRSPILAVNRRIDEKRVSYVNIDDYAAELRATEHLIRQGCRRLALINGDETLRNSMLRRDGFLGALKRNKIEAVPELMLSGEYTEGFGRAAAKRLLELPSQLRPDGIVTTSDVIALGVLKELLKQGINIPDEMRLIGFGNVESASYISPTLSTMSIPAREMGIQAANAIDYLMSSPSIQTIKILMRSELKPRGTTLPEVRSREGKAENK